MSTFQGEMKVGSRVRVGTLNSTWTDECRRLLPGKLGTVEKVHPARLSGPYLVRWDEPVTLHPNTTNNGFWFARTELEAP